jgi:hypothetical protein
VPPGAGSLVGAASKVRKVYGLNIGAGLSWGCKLGEEQSKEAHFHVYAPLGSNEHQMYTKPFSLHYIRAQQISAVT